MGRHLVVSNVVATTKHSHIIYEVIKSSTPLMERLNVAWKGFLIYS